MELKKIFSRGLEWISSRRTSEIETKLSDEIHLVPAKDLIADEYISEMHNRQCDCKIQYKPFWIRRFRKYRIWAVWTGDDVTRKLDGGGEKKQTNWMTEGQSKLQA